MDTSCIARVAHEADRALCALRGDLTGRSWLALDACRRDNVLRGVRVVIDTPAVSAEDLHASWTRDKRDHGWTWGPEFNADTKQDPMLLPWAQLSDVSRQRERLFVSIVRALTPAI